MRYRLCVLIGVFLLLCHATPSRAQVVPAVATAIAAELAGKKVSSIIEQFQRTGQTLIDQGALVGNALMTRAANEADVLSRNLAFQLQDQIDHTFDQLDQQQRLLVIEAESMRRSLEGVTREAYDLKDTTVVDLNRLTTALPFVQEKFFIQSIRGISKLPDATDMKLVVIGSQIGIQEGRTTAITMEINGQAVDLVRVDQSQQAGKAEVVIPNAVLAPLVQGQQLSVVPAKMTFTVTSEEGWWIFSKTVTKQFDVPVHLSLYPREFAKIRILAKLPVYEWVTTDKPVQKDQGTPNRHCERHCRGEPTRGPNDISIAVSGGPPPYKVGYERFRNPRFYCIAGDGACGFTDYSPNKIIMSNNDTRISIHWDTWSRPTTWRLVADLQRYTLVGEVEREVGQLSAEWNKVQFVDYPNPSNNVWLDVTTFTKINYQLMLKTPDPHNILRFLGDSDAGPGLKRATYGVELPQL